MSKRVERIFVGWDRPMLHSVRDFLMERAEPGPVARSPGGVPDLSGVTLVLPGARAGRRLLEILALGADGTPASRGAVLPPRIMTLGAWTGLGAPMPRPPAGDMARLGAWIGALRSLDEATLRHVARLGTNDDARTSAARWLGVARLVAACHRELAGEGIRFARVREQARSVPDFTDGRRWEALAQVQARYARLLEEAGLSDPELERLAAFEDGTIDPEALGGGGTVVFAGIAEMNRVARRMIDAVAGRCSVLVCAPADVAARFDEYGCVMPAAWEGARLDIADGAVIAAEGPSEQAAAALACVQRWAGAGARSAPSPDQITIGVPDPEVEERLIRLAGRLEGVPVRRAEGKALAFTRPVKLLLSVADYLERRDFASFAALVRHPDLEARIGAALAARGHGTAAGAWLHVLDTYQAEHLHGRVEGRWLTDDPERAPILDAVYAALHELLSADRGALLQEAARAPEQWCGALWDVVRAVYSRAPDLDAASREARFVVQGILQELDQVPRVLAQGLCLTPREGIRLLVHETAGESIPEAADTPAIDLVGWLELAADDAPRMVVTGMNEGLVPSRAGVDPLLPEGLRRALGLSDRRARLARDAYAAGMMVHPRPPGDLAFIFGRRSAPGDPLAPSRLLLMGAPESLPARVRLWAPDQDGPPAAPAPLMIRHADTSGFETSPRARELEPPGRVIDEMSVTSFRDYLASPYGFYLKHVLGLEDTGDEGVELDPLRFGNLLHDVLRTLDAEAVAASTNPDRIAAFLVSQLEATSRLLFGDDPRPEIALQVEQARARLTAFAGRQAEWAGRGWRVAHAEWDPGPRAAFVDVDGTPMYLRGRIDRIDVNEREGTWAVLDYKTSNTPPTPQRAFTQRKGWTDPQLPLYRHLAARLGLKGEPTLAWIALPREIARTEFVVADWSSDQLAEADQAVADVVRAVRRGEFGTYGDDPPGEGILGWLCGGLAREDDDA